MDTLYNRGFIKFSRWRFNFDPDINIDKEGHKARVLSYIPENDHARKFKRAAISLGIGLTTIFHLTRDISLKGYTACLNGKPDGNPYWLVRNLTAMVVIGLAAYRFHKVDRGDWSFTRKVPPKEQRQEQPDTVPGAAHEVG